MKSLEATIHNQIDVLDQILPGWEKLKTEYEEVTFFQELGWLKSWWKMRSENKNIKPYIVELKSNNNTIAIFPFYLSYKEFSNVQFRILRPMGSYLSDYLLPICSKEFSLEKQFEKVLDTIFEDKSGWDCIDWNDIPEGSKLDVFLNNQYKTDNKNIKRKTAEVCPYLKLDKDVEKVKSKFSKKFLKGILYYERKLNREGELTYHRVNQVNEIEPIMKKMFELHCERWGMTETPSQFTQAKERVRAMEVAKHLFELDLLHLSYLKHDDEIAAIEFGMKDKTKRYLYIGAINVGFRKYPIGHILLYKLILEACEEDIKIMDFLRGEEGYKKRVGTIDKFNIHYMIFNQTLRSQLFEMVYRTYYSGQVHNMPRFKQVVSKSVIRGSVLFLKLPMMNKQSL